MIGKWVIMNAGDSYNVGQVIDVVFDHFLLIRIRPIVGPPRLGLFDLMSLTDPESESSFFDTEQELDAFLAWLEAPEEGRLRVVSINKKDGGEEKEEVKP